MCAVEDVEPFGVKLAFDHAARLHARLGEVLKNARGKAR
jgi:hypothetical protein